MRDSSSVLSRASRESLENASSDEQSSAFDGATTLTEPSREEIAKAESKGVKKMAVAVFSMLLFTSSLVVGFTMFFLSNQEHREFETAFYGYARATSDVSHFHGRNIIEAFLSTSDTITSHAIASKQKWPFVTIPHVEVRFAHARFESFTEVVGFCPFVSADQRSLWGKYSVNNQDWIQESLEAQEVADDNDDDDDDYNKKNSDLSLNAPSSIPEDIYVLSNNGSHIPDKSWGPFAPMWQISPPPFSASIVNYNLLSDPKYFHLVEAMKASRHHVISGIRFDHNIYDHVLHLDEHEKFHSDHHFNKSFTAEDHPHSTVLFPIFDSYNDNSKIVGFLEGLLPWDAFLMDILPPGVDGITCVIQNTCGDVFSYEIDGHDAFYIGWGDHHEHRFNEWRVDVDFMEFDGLVDNHIAEGQCHYSMIIYPSTKFRESYDSERPELFTSLIAAIFLMTFLVFFVFLYCVHRRQRKVLITAERTTAIVSSLFPDSVRDRIMKDIEEQVQAELGHTRKSSFFKEAPKQRLKSFLGEESPDKKANDVDVFASKPIADLFPETTVLFADIVGFTAWSSVREPSQVFQLLETIYRSFDQIAKRRRVFKVETIGDCYVAVTGLPDPRKDHAMVMARFARDCMYSVHDLVKRLEVTLGPDTGDLSMRFGMHSGPTTGGVLRGDKSRFQLFGDTVNTAARMESNGKRGHIHISQETADLLAGAGKSKWITPREDKICVKGKGELQTFWLEVKGDNTASNNSGSSDSVEGGSNLNLSTELHPKWDQPSCRQTDDKFAKKLRGKLQRLVDWNVDQLIKLLQHVVARRNALQRVSGKTDLSESLHPRASPTSEKNCTVLEEVKEVITLPNFDSKTFKSIENPDSIELSSDAVSQLRDYVSNVAILYKDNPFHNFEHASHVTMSVCKLLSRIVAPDDVNYEGGDCSANGGGSDQLACALHDYTHGITSDPLTGFSVAFSALIHDADHRGVPNTQLIKEEPDLGSMYKNQSVAEQNSVDIAWKLLMEEKYAALRSVIFTTKSEFQRFRQLVVNSVMATDIVDKELKELRNGRWEKAFSDTETEDSDEDRNRKATIVIEHLIQASDVAHTMQHWHIYRKWNERFFQEMYLAYKSSRSDSDPSAFWYKGELGFFDFYIIPLAKKLKDCGVFGVSSDEYLNYAIKNRKEWEIKGEAVVQEMLENVKNLESSTTEARTASQDD